jgi:subtilisin
VLLRAVEAAYAYGVTLFAAAHNDHPLTRSYPALHAAPLISVDQGETTEPGRFRFAPNEGVEFSAYARGYLGAMARERATSWATPHLAAQAVRLLGVHPGLRPFELKTILAWLADR